jgi:hypothetical protein
MIKVCITWRSGHVDINEVSEKRLAVLKELPSVEQIEVETETKGWVRVR